MGSLTDITGKRFGELTALRRAPTPGGRISKNNQVSHPQGRNALPYGVVSKNRHA